MTRLVVATNNRGKLAEIESVLAGLGLELVAQSELGIPEADETGLTFVENALLKARQACERSGLPALADDSGLCVDALDGAPGLISAHYGGVHGADARFSRFVNGSRARLCRDDRHAAALALHPRALVREEMPVLRLQLAWAQGPVARARVRRRAARGPRRRPPRFRSEPRRTHDRNGGLRRPHAEPVRARRARREPR